MVRRLSRVALTAALLVLLLSVALPLYAQGVPLQDALDELRGTSPTFSENFRRDTGLWELDLDSAESSIRIESGAYHVAALEPNYFVWGVAELDFGDFFAEVEATRVAGPLDNEYGIVFRHVDAQNFYTFLVSSDGYYALRSLQDGEWVEILPWTETDLLDLDEDATNLVGVFAQGDRIALLINTQVVDEVIDDTFSSGAIALGAGAFDEAGVEVAFDILEVWDLDEVDLPVIADSPGGEPVDVPGDDPTEPTNFDADAIADRLDTIRSAAPDVSESFRTDSGAWSLDTDETVEYLIERRQLTIQVFDPNWMGWSLLEEPMASDLLLEADVELLEGPTTAESGLLFRYLDGANFYYFPITGDGSWSLWRLVEDEWEEILPWTESDLIETGQGARNRISVLAEGDEFSLIINDVPVAVAVDDTFAEGAVALAVGTFNEPDALVAFDDVDFWVLSESVQNLPDDESVEVGPADPDALAAAADRLDEVTAFEPTLASDFRRDDGSWNLESDEDVTMFYERRALKIAIDRTDWANWSVHNELNVADFAADVDVTFEDGPESGEYGIVFRVDGNDFYFFAVSGNGYYGLFRSDGEEWTDLVTWSASDAIATGVGATNNVAVLAEGPVMTVFINGEALAQFEDDTYTSGEIGLAAGTFSEEGLVVSFDNFRYWALDEGG